MGFGTLFIGYFLLLNLTYYVFTDAIAAAVMLLALYKLSPINKPFKYAMYSAVAFLVFSVANLGVNVYEMFFGAINNALLYATMACGRYMLICALSVIMLKGAEEIAKEVDLKDVATKASRLITLCAFFFSLLVLTETIPITNTPIAIIAAVSLIAVFALMILNLTVIYSCYMKICMPESLNKQKASTEKKPSKFGFVNEYRARKAEREAEAQKERIEMLKKRAEKMKGKKK